MVADALNCQKKTAQAVIDGGGDYLLAVKENQKDLYNDFTLLFETEHTGMQQYENPKKDMVG